MGVYPNPTPTEVALVVEFFSPTLDHYFITQNPDEIRDLDTGVHPGWMRTGQSFLAYLPGKSDARGRAVSRYYGLPQAGLDSHFHTWSVREVRALSNPPFVAAWSVEDNDVLEIPTPDTLTGSCPVGTIPLYRLWNQRRDSNHRYTTDVTTKNAMIAAGFVAEGYGPNNVFMCSPT